MRVLRVRHQHLRHEFAQGLHGVARVLVHVDQDMGGRQSPQAGEVDVLGSAHLGHVAHGVGRVHAEPGARHDLRAQSEVEQGFGQARHQAGDARVLSRRGEGLAQGVREGGGLAGVLRCGHDVLASRRAATVRCVTCAACGPGRRGWGRTRRAAGRAAACWPRPSAMGWWHRRGRRRWRAAPVARNHRAR
ncbi:hypothetical protein GALL_331010 [mine drainage metagenome]|uniref:Uncharacterized protein n=1 Tax=mine drainage metagenome TaxID=410659 RepID=A0A1J5QNC7_9ZZZZ